MFDLSEDFQAEGLTIATARNRLQPLHFLFTFLTNRRSRYQNQALISQLIGTSPSPNSQAN